MNNSEVKIFDDRYLLTAEGKVFSIIFKNATCSRPRAKPLLLKQGTSTNGYKYVRLSAKSGDRPMNYYIHQLVAKMFLGDMSKKGLIVCHKNGNRLDNRVENIKWATQKENQHDRREHGTANIGEKNPGSKLTEKQVYQIHQLLKTKTKKDIAATFKLHRETIYHISIGKTWNHIYKALRESK